MPNGIIIVQSDPVAGRERAYEDWYLGQHLHDVVAVPGFASARFFAASQTQRDGVPAPAYGHLAIYEVDCPVPEALANLGAARDAGMFVSPAMKTERLLHAFDAMGERLRS